MTFEQCIVLCKHKHDHPQLTQNDLILWLENSHKVKVSQATISSTLKRTDEFLNQPADTNVRAK